MGLKQLGIDIAYLVLPGRRVHAGLQVSHRRRGLVARELGFAELLLMLGAILADLRHGGLCVAVGRLGIRQGQRGLDG